MPRPSYRRVRSLVASVVAASAVVAAASAVPSLPAGAAVPGLLDRSRLSVFNGNLTVTQNGAVVEDLEIRGSLRIEASNVTVRNVWVYTTGFWTVYVARGSALFENVEIGNASAVGERGIGGGNITVRLADIHHVEDGIKMGSNSVYDNVRVHDLASPNPSPHSDAIQNDGGNSNVIVRNSSLDSRGASGGLGNAAIQIDTSLGSVNNIRIENNFLNGGNYVVFSREEGTNGDPTNVVLIGNRFGRDYRYGLLSVDGTIVTQNNVWADTGLPINGQQGGPPPSTTVPPVTTAPRPSTTLAPTTTVPRPTTTVAPATTAPRPTTTVAPATTAPRPTTTVAPATTAPRPTTTAAPSTTAPPVTTAQPITTAQPATTSAPAATTAPPTTSGSPSTELPATSATTSNTTAPSSRSVTTTAGVDTPNASRSEVAGIFDSALANSAAPAPNDEAVQPQNPGVEFGATPNTGTATGAISAAQEGATPTAGVKVGGIIVQAADYAAPRTPIASPLAVAIGAPTADVGVVAPGNLYRVALVMARDPLISTALLSMAFFTLAVGLRSLVDHHRRQVFPQPKSGALAALLFPPKHLRSQPGPETWSWSAGVEPATRAKHLKRKAEQ